MRGGCLRSLECCCIRLVRQQGEMDTSLFLLVYRWVPCLYAIVLIKHKECEGTLCAHKSVERCAMPP